MAKRPRARTERRKLERRVQKVGAGAERVFGLGPGGSPEQPIVVDTVSVIEARARVVPCPRCGAEQEVIAHEAVTVSERRLRKIHLACRGCHSRRFLRFQLALLN